MHLPTWPATKQTKDKFECAQWELCGGISAKAAFCCQNKFTNANELRLPAAGAAIVLAPAPVTPTHVPSSLCLLI